MDPVLRESIEPVLRDLARAGLHAPRFDDEDWQGFPGRVSCMLRSAGGSGTGMSVRRADPLAMRVVDAADQIQEWVIEDQLWMAGRTNWPPCPNHPDTHPLQAEVAESMAVWSCPGDGAVVAPIGAAQ